MSIIKELTNLYIPKVTGLRNLSQQGKTSCIIILNERDKQTYSQSRETSRMEVFVKRVNS